jgi:anti-sigma B factor antagonist
MAVTPENGQANPLERKRDEHLVSFRCDVLSVADHAVVVARGEVDVASSVTLLHEISATLALPITGMTVDLAYVTFLDSSGVNALVVARTRASEQGIDFRLESVPRQARRVLEVCGLLDVFGLSARSDAAVPSPLGSATTWGSGRSAS